MEVAKRPVQGQPAMRAGADAGIVAHPPVHQIVSRLGAGPGVIRHFVGRKGRLGTDLGGRKIHVSGQILVRQAAQFTFGVQRPKAVPSSIVSWYSDM
jgi:hypothetical protein